MNFTDLQEQNWPTNALQEIILTGQMKNANWSYATNTLLLWAHWNLRINRNMVLHRGEGPFISLLLITSLIHILSWDVQREMCQRIESA